VKILYLVATVRHKSLDAASGYRLLSLNILEYSKDLRRGGVGGSMTKYFKGIASR